MPPLPSERAKSDLCRKCKSSYYWCESKRRLCFWCETGAPKHRSCDDPKMSKTERAKR